MNNTEAKPAKRAPIDARLQAHLGDRLRKIYAETARQPIPDRFSNLLDRLETDGNAVEGHRGSKKPKVDRG
jgi:hypothetical protein